MRRIRMWVSVKARLDRLLGWKELLYWDGWDKRDR